jgi:nucleoside-diphosphate-sugar epimerase
MTATGTTLVIGATGTTGSRTAAQLTAVGHRVKAASRKAAPVPARNRSASTGTTPLRIPLPSMGPTVSISSRPLATPTLRR